MAARYKINVSCEMSTSIPAPFAFCESCEGAKSQICNKRTEGMLNENNFLKLFRVDSKGTE